MERDNAASRYFSGILDRRFARYVSTETELLEAWADAVRGAVGYIGIVAAIRLRQPLVWLGSSDGLVVEGLGDGYVYPADQLSDQPFIDLRADSLTLQNVRTGSGFGSFVRVTGSRTAFFDNCRVIQTDHTFDGQGDTANRIGGRIRDCVFPTSATFDCAMGALSWSGGRHNGDVSAGLVAGPVSIAGVYFNNSAVTITGGPAGFGSVVGCIKIGTLTTPSGWGAAGNT